MVKIRIETDYKGKKTIGKMRDGVWHYADLPTDLQTEEDIRRFIETRAQGKGFEIEFVNV